KYPALVLQVIEAIARHLQLFQRGFIFEAAPAALARAHEHFQALLRVADVIGAGFELLAHGDGFFRANFGTPAAVSAPAAHILQNTQLLTDVEHQNAARRAVVGAPAAAHTLFSVEHGTSAESFRNRLPLRRIGQSDLPCAQAEQGFFEFAQQRNSFSSSIAKCGQYQGHGGNAEQAGEIAQGLVNAVTRVRGRNYRYQKHHAEYLYPEQQPSQREGKLRTPGQKQGGEARA